MLGRGLIMPEPKSYGGELCHGKVVQGDAVEACADVPELLEFSDASFDEVALLVCALRVRGGLSAVDLGRDAGLAFLVLDDLADPVGVIGTIGEHDGPSGQIVEEKLRHRRVVGLSGGELELHRQAIADDADVQLGRQSSTTSTDTSVSSLFFGRPPADARARWSNRSSALCRHERR